MFRIGKILNHNSIIGIRVEDNKEYLIMGKGVAFGRKICERIETIPEDTVYSLQEFTERGKAKDIIKSVSPVCLELANEVLNRAEKEFGKIDRSIRGEKLKVSMNDYMEVKFPEAFHIAEIICAEMERSIKITLDDVEVGYLAIHIERVMDNELSEQ